MSAAENSDSQPPVDRNDEAVVHGEPYTPTISASDSATCTENDVLCSADEGSRVLPPLAGGSSETAIPVDVKETVPLRVEREDADLGDTKNQATVSVPVENEDTEAKVEKNENDVEDYDSMLFEFDRFVYKGGGESVGNGFEIGDIVWGKVKSHPWWPGLLFNEVLASPSVRKTKREGHVLVSFFGDNSYGWFDPEELVPFVEGFDEKSKQMSSPAFSKAVEEAIDELSRRKCLGLACRCRNEFNFWPFSLEGFFVVYGGDNEPNVYSSSQINRAREDVRPKEMVSFVRKLALRPFDADNGSIQFVQNKATVLACRKALFEEFDETYAEAFGTIPERPPRPTAPVAVDPSGVTLSGRLVFPEALGEGKLLVTPDQTKDPLEEEDVVLKDYKPVFMKPKKNLAHLIRPLPADSRGLSRTLVDSSTKVRSSPSIVNILRNQATLSDTKPSADSREVLQSVKKPKAIKRQAVEMSSVAVKSKKRKKESSSQRPPCDFVAPPLTWVKKKRTKVIRNGMSRKNLPCLQVGEGDTAKAKQQVLEPLLDVPVRGSSNEVDNKQSDGIMASLAGPQEDNEIRNADLRLLVRDLCTVAVNPSHGIESRLPAMLRWIFLKYRSLVFQKSVVLSPPPEKEANEVRLAPAPAPAPTALPNPAYRNSDKPTVKYVRPAPRPSDRLEMSKKRKLDDSKDIHPKTLGDSVENGRKKPMSESKPQFTEKKTITNPKSAVLQRRDVREAPPKNAHPKAPKPGSIRINKPVKERRRTAMIMRFPKGASLPSNAELAARFARFGPLEYSSTRVFWQTNTCRIVFQYKVDAEAALKFAASSHSLFGYENVFCHLKDASSEVAEPETASKLRKAGVQPAVPLKSCLKKSSNDESGNGSNGRGTTRVKFVLDGDVEQNSVSSTTMTPPTSYSMDISSSKNRVVANLNPQPPVVVPKFASQPELRPPVNFPVDISGEMLSLLHRCRDVVDNVKGAVGYVPYRPL